jgi:hypothetical protein
MINSNKKFHLSKQEELRFLEGLRRQDPDIEREFCETFLPIFVHLLKGWGIPGFQRITKIMTEGMSGLEASGEGEDSEEEAEDREVSNEETLNEETSDEESHNKTQNGKRRYLDDKEGIANEVFVQLFRKIRSGRQVVDRGLFYYLTHVLRGKSVDYLVWQWRNPELQRMYRKVKGVRKKQKDLLKEIREIELPYTTGQPKDPSSSLVQWEEIGKDLRIYIPDLDVERMPEPIRQERKRLYQNLNELYEQEEKATDDIVDYEHNIRGKITNTDPPSQNMDIEDELMRRRVHAIVKEVVPIFPEDEQPIIKDYYYHPGKQPGYEPIAGRYNITVEDVRRICGQFLQEVKERLMRHRREDCEMQ